MAKKLKSDSMDLLFKAFLQLKTIDECYAFFEDLCTVSELRAMAQRFEVAKMLEDGLTYTVIEEKTGVSPATISRVKTSLENGADGYKMMLERVKS